ncbi:hypothetical protein LI90_266 [Carbonactinospora thermoautotrophica]|uniref:ATPase AAA n=1 Tax=Carbonactinospora thermoautotrophica TaxID=1469144 RepID=A0A132MLL9_9ACTN|nr:DUF499 domain-containing protein [Carbonactinospora thermoautotrophica]KWW98639.1 hypothetical protein LI90_266 [Carbonactinospora thermoautotrophica]
MESLFERVVPRREVLAGELTEARFAASLEEVVAETAPDAYGDADAFFAATYPSAGLRSLLNEALGRVGGGKPDGASVIRLETNLGGGKTHNLIALYHAARGQLSRERAPEFMDPGLLPQDPVSQIGVFVGTSSGATSFPETDGVTPRTVWGHLALQVAGRAGYEHVRADDEALTAPGATALKRVFGDAPTLLLIDEIARYYAVARGVRVGDTTLAGQTTAFLMALMEAVDALPRAVLVITTTEVTDAFGEDTAEVLEAINEARSLMARKELVLKPSEEVDLPKILARRLFESLPADAAAPVAEAYAAAADAAADRGLDLPEGMTGAGWATEITQTYPFHPALIRVLDKRLSTIPNFQRTRGALRLLARVIRRLWNERPDGVGLIHLHHVDLADKVISEELSSRLERPQFEPVIRADVASQPGSEPSHAERVDERMGSRYGRRLATAIYLYSLTRDVPGVPVAELYGAVLAPGDDPNLMQRALEGLEESCWYLHSDVRGYRFSTEASLVKLIQEAEREVSVTKARAHATKILANQFRDGVLKVRRAWENAKVPDNADDAWLVIFHWDDFGDARGVDPHGPIPAKVRELWERTAAGGKREYRNRLVILAPSRGTHDAMVRAVRTHLALEALWGNAETRAALGDDKWNELKKRLEESELFARIAVCNHVNVLYVPTASGLETVELDVVTQASVRPNQTDAIVERLAAMDKTLAAGDKPLDPGYVKAKLGALLTTSQPTMELVRAFARRTDLKMVFDRAQLVALVAAGVRNGAWEYQDPERGDEGWATKDRPTTAVRLAENTYLHPVGSAPAPKEQLCPFCGTSHPGVGCPDTVDTPGGSGSSGGDVAALVPTRFTGAGAAGKAFVDARTAAAEAGRAVLRELVVEIDHVGEGAGTELARLHTIVPTGSLGVRLVYDVEASVSLSSDPSETALVRYHGSPTDYAPLREALKQLLAPRQATLRARIHAVFENPLQLSGEEVNQLAQRASDTGPTKCTITFVTEGET